MSSKKEKKSSRGKFPPTTRSQLPGSGEVFGFFQSALPAGTPGRQPAPCLYLYECAPASYECAAAGDGNRQQAARREQGTGREEGGRRELRTQPAPHPHPHPKGCVRHCKAAESAEFSINNWPDQTSIIVMSMIHVHVHVTRGE